MPEPNRPQTLQLVIITGLSGAGKTQAVHAFEDMGYFCVDNLPPTLIPKFAELCLEGQHSRVAVVVDIRGGEFFASTAQALEELDRMGVPYRILFLEADDDTLVRRFKETRRRHPLARDVRVVDAIAAERRLLEGLRGRAHAVIDTSGLNPHELRRAIFRRFADDQGGPSLTVNIVTFGFKHGLPADADLVFDVRFLPNPHYVPSLRDASGSDPRVRDYVLQWSVTRDFLKRLNQLIDFLVPQYLNEGRTQLTIAVGCTGGRHRSVVIGEQLARHLRARFPSVAVQHRDVEAGAIPAAALDAGGIAEGEEPEPPAGGEP